MLDIIRIGQKSKRGHQEEKKEIVPCLLKHETIKTKHIALLHQFSGMHASSFAAFYLCHSAAKHVSLACIASITCVCVYIQTRAAVAASRSIRLIPSHRFVMVESFGHTLAYFDIWRCCSDDHNISRTIFECPLDRKWITPASVHVANPIYKMLPFCNKG